MTYLLKNFSRTLFSFGLALFVAIGVRLSAQESAVPSYTLDTTRQYSLPREQSVFERQNIENYFGVGLQAGQSTGLGVSTRLLFPNRMGFELNFGVISGSSKTSWDVGTEFQFKLDNSTTSRVYMLVGTAYYSFEDSRPVRLALGVGYEAVLSGKLAWNIEVPLTMRFGGTGSTEIYPLPQAGLIFYFN